MRAQCRLYIYALYEAVPLLIYYLEFALRERFKLTSTYYDDYSDYGGVLLLPRTIRSAYLKSDALTTGSCVAGAAPTVPSSAPDAPQTLASSSSPTSSSSSLPSSSSSSSFPPPRACRRLYRPSARNVASRQIISSAAHDSPPDSRAIVSRSTPRDRRRLRKSNSRISQEELQVGLIRSQ